MNDSKPHSQSPTASTWRPSQEVELIVGTPPGGGQDRPARALIKVMESTGLIDVPMKLTNIAGKGGGKAWDALRARAGDAHVLSISSPPLLSNRWLGVADFDHAACTPLANLYTEYLAFIVPAASPLRDAAALLERLRADAGSLSISLATAIGSTNHIALGQIMQHLGRDPKALQLHVFDSALYAVTDVVEGKADVGVISAVSAVKAIEAGQVRAIAVSAPARMGGVFSAAPAWSELSVPCVIGQWRGIMGAPGINAAQIDYWERAFAAAAARAEWNAELERNYWTNTFMNAKETGAFMNGEREFVGRMLRALGLIS
jgi:putative tricarboxylic transport membrane protein